MKVDVANNGPGDASGAITLSGVSNRGETVEFTGSFTGLKSAEELNFEWDWTAAPERKPSIFRWTAIVTSSVEDTNPLNDTMTAKSKVRRSYWYR